MEYMSIKELKLKPKPGIEPGTCTLRVPIKETFTNLYSFLCVNINHFHDVFKYSFRLHFDMRQHGITVVTVTFLAGMSERAGNGVVDTL